MPNHLFLLLTLFFASLGSVTAQRTTQRLTDGWTFHYGYDVLQKPTKTPVTLPHTWNAGDTHVGLNYFRGVGVYENRLTIPANWRGQRLVLRFEGVNSTAQVLLNQQYVGQHEGGYTAFCLDITDRVQYGADNLLTVQVSNAYRSDVLPLSGDFVVYGGIHRPVSLLVLPPNCISPFNRAAPGVQLQPLAVSRAQATVRVRTYLSLTRPAPTLRTRVTLLDGAGRVVQTRTGRAAGATNEQTLVVDKPHLWQGRADPYLYRVAVDLLDGERVLDHVEQPLGLRYYTVDPDKGFFLNGTYLDLHGVCRHQDVAGKGSALTDADQQRDIDLLTELGATAIRLTHYPHSEAFYDRCDRAGIVVWSEIPLVGPGGYSGAGYTANPGLHAHARQVLQEMIQQHYNHPSICFWGLFNELKLDYDRPDAFVRSLNQLAKTEDPHRPTTLATFQADSVFTDLTDLMAWNKYYGWYGGKADEMGRWADNVHRALPRKPVGIGEYGAGGSIRHHEDTLRPTVPNSRWHPEAWQTHYHEENWRQLGQRPFLWAKFIWVLADFASPVRFEGDTTGINDKGLVTYDRQTKKDAFYFYKANWNPAPMVYLTNRRHTRRKQPTTTVTGYSTLPELELLVNGQPVGRARGDELHRFVFPNVRLQPGKNTVLLRGTSGTLPLEDQAEWWVE